VTEANLQTVQTTF